MKITILGSGSKGNSTLIEFDSIKVLIDIGFPYKYIKDTLSTIKVYPKDIDYIFITHDHVDHIYGLETFLIKNKPVVFVREKIANKYAYLQQYEKVEYLNDDLMLEEFDVKTIPTSHDAVDSVGFVFQNRYSSLVFITDTGYINHKYFKHLFNKTYYCIESNHDIDMLTKGRYPYFLQRRILSNNGHLSNRDCSIYLTKFIGNNTKKIFLMHLSEENNTESQALSTINEIFKDHNISFRNIECAKQNEVVKTDD